MFERILVATADYVEFDLASLVVVRLCSERLVKMQMLFIA